MNALVFHVVWPILDDSMRDDEAMADAWLELPGMAEERQITLVGSPQMRVADLTPAERQQFKAARAVVCDAPVVKRASTPQRQKEKAA